MRESEYLGIFTLIIILKTCPNEIKNPQKLGIFAKAKKVFDTKEAYMDLARNRM
jgi:hypothetical protein